MFALYCAGLRHSQTVEDPQSASAAHSSYEQNVGCPRAATQRPLVPAVQSASIMHLSIGSPNPPPPGGRAAVHGVAVARCTIGVRGPVPLLLVLLLVPPPPPVVTVPEPH